MKFLHVTPITPARSGSGLAMRAGLFTQALAGLGAVEVLVLPVAEAGPPTTPFFLGDAAVRRIETRGRGDTRFALLRQVADFEARLSAFRDFARPSMCGGLSAPVLAEAGAAIAAAACDAAVVSRAYLLGVLEHLPAGAALPPVIADLDDDDGAYFRELAGLARAQGGDQAARWHEAEADAFDALVRAGAARVRRFACASPHATASAAARLAIAAPVTVPNGVDADVAAVRDAEAHSLLFVGNLSYVPNQDGIVWFIEAVLPRLREAVPQARLTVAGSAPAAAVRRACEAPGVTLAADPGDLAPLYARAAAAIVPLRLGSGSRIKILEAGAHGVPVVSTAKGAEGLGLDPARHFFEAEASPQDLAAACIACLGDASEAGRRAAALRAFVRCRHDRQAVVARIAALVGEVVAG